MRMIKIFSITFFLGIVGFLTSCNKPAARTDETSDTQSDTTLSVEYPEEELGWKLGAHSYTFRLFTFFEAIDKIDSCNLKYVEGFSGQVIGGGIDGKMDYKMEAATREKVPNIRLYFMGLKSPNPKVPLMRMAVDAQELASQLDLTGKNVFFGEGWVSYEDRVNYLLDADIAVSAHFDLVETRFSFRTRILDYLWAGLPVLSTGGDQLSDTIAARGAGLALPYNDSDAWRDAIVRLCLEPSERQRCSQAARELAAEYTWDKTCRALLQFCRHPHHLPAFEPITMPSLLERAKSVYARGGHELVLKRSKEILTDLFQ